MFTGIVSGIGRIVEVAAARRRRVVRQGADDRGAGRLARHSAIGDSIALAGACMTIVSIDAAHDRFQVEVSAESLAATHGLDAPATSTSKRRCAPATGSTATWSAATSTVSARSTRFERAGESWQLEVAAPLALARFLALKGSIAVDGVSLTVNRVADTADGVRRSAST